jgi:hypothetical protein
MRDVIHMPLLGASGGPMGSVKNKSWMRAADPLKSVRENAFRKAARMGLKEPAKKSE